MFERFTERARRVVVLAQQEARGFGHSYIGAEHILLALIGERTGIAAQALKSLGIADDVVRQQIAQVVGLGQQAPGGHIPFTAQAKKVLEGALREAVQLGQSYVGTEHVLLALTREGEGAAAQVLTALGADNHGVRRQVLDLVDAARAEDDPGQPRAAGRPAEAAQPTRKLLAELVSRLNSVESRLSTLEHLVGTGPDLRDLDRRSAQARRDKESAIEIQDFEDAAALRDTEKQLLDEKASCQEQWRAAHMDSPSLSDEVARLRDLLRQHGIDPQQGAA
ncbi:MAG: hypothetical protein JO132_12505 [Streptosporangiaceae bacterium]|nr:hypothetical protein [Streptosporangiaceae bacterium]